MLWLTEQSHLSAGKIRALLAHFGSAEEVYRCDRAALYAEAPLSSKEIAALMSSKDERETDGLIRELERNCADFVSCKSERFPELLRSIDDCPFGLYYIGRLPADELTVAVIGAREATDYGMNAAYRLARELAENGVAIVSGMARGIDGMAHKGALDGKGYTIAVLGTPVQLCYPKEHERLYLDIARRGCLVSEIAPWGKSVKASFARRNRIISGLSRGVVVVEAALRSGTSITVDQAASQGRDIFAVPGNIFSELSAGTNSLLKDGAVIVTSAADVLSEYEHEFTSRAAEPEKAADDSGNSVKSELKDISGLDTETRIIYDTLCRGDKSADELCASSGYAIPRVLYCLTILEIGGFAEAVPGGKYRII